MRMSAGVSSLLSFALCVGSGTAFARTISIASSDKATGAVSLTLSPGGADESPKPLIAAWAPGEIGASPTNASAWAFVGLVDAETTDVAFTVPGAWRTKSGTVRFFLMREQPPYVRRFTCLRTPAAGPYVDTGFVPDADTDISVKAAYPSDMAPFGVSGKLYFFSNSSDKETNGNYYCGFFGANNGGRGFNAPRGSAPRTFRINSTGAMIDGTRYSVMFDPTTITETTTSTLTLFARKNDGQTMVGKQGDVSIYAAQIRQAGVLTHDYVPCETANGVKTLYNRVDGTFCVVSGTGTFEAGEEVCPAPQDCGDVECTTEALVFAPALSIVGERKETGEITVALAGEHDGGLLLAVAAAADAGTSAFSAWEDCAFLGKVPPGANTATVALPTAWWETRRPVRLVWKSAAGFACDCEVAYVHSDGRAWAATDWIPTVCTDVRVTGRAANDVCLTGLTERFYYFFINETAHYGFFGESGTFAIQTPFVAHTLEFGAGGVFLDGERKADSFANATPSVEAYPLTFPFRRSRSDGSLTKMGNAWLSGAQIRERGELVRDFVPCVSNGVAGLYDRVHGAFLPSATDTPFNAGEAVVPAMADGDILAWSDVFTPSVVTATWDGGGASDCAFTTAANWVGDETPELSDYSTMLAFATAGTSALMDESVCVRGLRFNAKDNFTVAAARDDARLSIGAFGIALLDDPAETLSTWRFATLACGVDLATDQTWDLSSNSQRRLQLAAEADLSGSAARTLTITGKGVLGLVSTNSFAGDVRINGGVMKVCSKKQPFGTAADGGTVTLDQTLGAAWEQYDGTMDKPLTVVGGNVSDTSFCLRTVDGVSTNMFTAPVTVRDGRLNMLASSPVVFAGGGTFNATVQIGGGGALVFCGEPIKGRAWVTSSAARNVWISTKGNDVSWSFASGGEVHVLCDDAFTYWSDLTLNGTVSVDLHGTAQNLGDITMTGTDSCITSSTPARVFAYYDSSSDDAVLKGCIAGAVEFRKSGWRTAVLQGVNTSTGTLVAQNGTLVIGENGRWTGTDIRVGDVETNRKPTLRLTHNGVFAHPRQTEIVLTTSTSESFSEDMGDRNPVLSLDAGVALHVKSLTIDGRSWTGGWWGGPDSSAEHKDAVHFAGAGKIYVAGGMVLIFR